VAEEPPTGLADIDLRPPSRLWRCPDQAVPCTEILGSGLTSRMFVVAVELRPDLIQVYLMPPDGADAVQLLDASTFEPRSALITKAGSGTTGWGFAPDLSWVIYDDFNPAGIVVYSTADGHHITEFPRNGESVQFAVHPDGSVIIVAHRLTGESSIIRTDSWEMVDSGIPAGDAAAATFSLDGKSLATTDLDGRVTLRDPVTFEELRVMDGAMGFATFVNQAFSDDGRYLLSVHGTTAVLWDTASGRPIGDPIVSLQGSGPVALAGEHTIFLGASEQWIELWHLDVDEYPSLACRAAGRNLTPAEWDELGPQDEPYHATCSEWV
jgi:WD40 repeat protein